MVMNTCTMSGYQQLTADYNQQLTRPAVRFYCSIISLFLLFSASILSASDDMPEYGRTATIDFLMERAISNNLIGGAVVVIGNHDGILSSTARGRLNSNPDSPLLNQQTIFDLASLTKVIATAPAVMKLLDEGHITLQDTLSLWFPEFKGSQFENTTILNLLTHTSGLTDFEMSTEQSMQTAIHRAAAEKQRQGAGISFNYADINFILLGELVHRVSGKTLDVYCREELYTPLFTTETMFLPTLNITDRIAPTLGSAGGTVQDQNARRLGSVAGHAGLFSSAQDLARFARMMLDGGAIDGRRILSEEAVKQMTSPFLCSNHATMRGLGWDIDSPFSSPKGRLFSAASFGHTGYSGSSIWIDPQQDLFVILLTNRLNYRDIRMFNQLRSDISTIAVAEFRKPGGIQLPAVAGYVARMPANQHRAAARKKPAASRGSRLVAVVSEKHTRAYRQNGRKNVKKHIHKAFGRTRRA